MFEHIADRPATRGPWSAAILSISIVGHAAAGVALLVVALWQIDRLAAPERQVQMVTLARPQAISFDEPPPSRRVKSKARATPSSRPTRELVQSEQTSDTEVEVEVDFGPASGPGHEHGISDGRGSDTSALHIDDSGPGVPMASMEVKQPPPAPQPRAIAEHMLDGKRIAGNEQIRPPESVRLDMVRAGTRRLTATIKMCLDAQGRVASLEILKSSGHDAYDREFLREMRAWRYQPYRIDSVPVPVCTPINFVYAMTD